MFTNSVTDALSKINELALIGFGSFSVPAREGRNPKDGSPMKIAAYRQTRFKSGINIKKAVNAKK